jgi:hypothetical protein
MLAGAAAENCQRSTNQSSWILIYVFQLSSVGEIYSCGARVRRLPPAGTLGGHFLKELKDFFAGVLHWKWRHYCHSNYLRQFKIILTAAARKLERILRLTRARLLGVGVNQVTQIRPGSESAGKAQETSRQTLL